MGVAKLSTKAAHRTAVATRTLVNSCADDASTDDEVNSTSTSESPGSVEGGPVTRATAVPPAAEPFSRKRCEPTLCNAAKTGDVQSNCSETASKQGDGHRGG